MMLKIAWIALRVIFREGDDVDVDGGGMIDAELSLKNELRVSGSGRYGGEKRSRSIGGRLHSSSVQQG